MTCPKSRNIESARAKKWEPRQLLVGMHGGADAVENSLVVLQKIDRQVTT